MQGPRYPLEGYALMSQAHGMQDAYMDVGGRATQGTVAERPRLFLNQLTLTLSIHPE